MASCFTAEGGEQMVEDEVNGDDRSPHVTYGHQGLVHDVYPALLGEDLEHGHECLQGRRAHRMREGERRGESEAGRGRLHREGSDI
ncbi:hypothetical protein EYF80_055504 [Liparis tanakae]|uniref:Uncharacterized protein n=1 Tax=Liparis tanakae TaxID=230148 RepID=A0A4Z2EZE9_9TELE|nr:hypothetical protein EYF80_055504 [Liparis tanakae]